MTLSQLTLAVMVHIAQVVVFIPARSIWTRPRLVIERGGILWFETMAAGTRAICRNLLRLSRVRANVRVIGLGVTATLASVRALEGRLGPLILDRRFTRGGLAAALGRAHL